MSSYILKSHCSVQAAKGQAIEDLLCTLEGQTSVAEPTAKLGQLDGAWQLLYTSLAIKVCADSPQLSVNLADAMIYGTVCCIC